MRADRLAAIFAAFLLSAFAAAGQNLAKPSPAVPASTFDLSLDGPNWTLTPFAPGDGEKNHAYAQDFSSPASLKVSVPGEVQPLTGLKGMELFQESKKLSLINNQEWWYRTTFASPVLAPGQFVHVVFDGADYFSSVWINGHKLGDHEGSFTPFEFDITPYLNNTGPNTLAIRVTHPLLPKGRGLAEYMKGAFTQVVPWDLTIKEPPYALTSSWDPLADYGNATYAMGLWRGVHLKIQQAFTLHDLNVETDALNSDGSASVTISGVVHNDSDTSVTAVVHLTLAPQNFAGTSIPLPDQAVTVDGRASARFSFSTRVQNAQLWWTWDTGKQNLYQLTATLAQGQTINDTVHLVFGIRTIHRDADMTYYLNGKRIFLKGAWYPIADYYTSRVTPQFYRRDLTLFKFANFNSIVNFTIVEKPDFYDLCDQLGILIFVELPFPQFGPQHVVDMDSPRRAPYIATAAAAVRQIVTDLRHHPSIIEWVPLAESHNNAAGWGVEDIAFDQSGYQEFVDQIRDAIAEVSPHTIFQASFCDLGEHHFWTAAAGMLFMQDNYQDLFHQQANFVSEYGGNAMSSYQNLGRYLTPEEQWSSKPARQPSLYNLPIDVNAYANITSFQFDGLASLLDRTERFVDRDPRSVRDLVDDTQVYHAFNIKYAAEAFHRKKYDPIKGMRLWSFVELNPGFHFTIVDYDRVPKIAYWRVKSAQAPLSLSFAFERALESIPGGSQVSIPVWAVNDFHSPRNVTLHCDLYDLEGHALLEKQFSAELKSDSSAQVGVIDWTTPTTPGVYMLRGTMTAEGSSAAQPIVNTIYLKVVHAAFAHPHRVLLIAQRKWGNPIADTLRGLGVQVDFLDDDDVNDLYSINDGALLHARYDVIWLGPFESIWKVLTNSPAPQAIADAVKAGTAFIATGGRNSFHGGYDGASVINLTALADILPVQISDRIDLVQPPLNRKVDARDWSTLRMRDIQFVDLSGAWADPGYGALGVTGFNRTTLKPGAQLLWSLYGSPLLASGTYGAGRTFAFTGYTRSTDEHTDGFLDEQMVTFPEAEAFTGLAAEMLSAATGDPLTVSVGALRDEHEKPLFQTLKESPSTTLTASIAPEGPANNGDQRYRIEITNGPRYARLVRILLDDAQQHNPNIIPLIGDSFFDMLPNQRKTVTLDWIQQDPSAHTLPSLEIEATNAASITLTAKQ